MEGKRRVRVLAVGRRYEPNRLEEEIWALAYEQVWPIHRKRLDGCVRRAEEEGQAGDRAVALARSA